MLITWHRNDLKGNIVQIIVSLVSQEDKCLLKYVKQLDKCINFFRMTGLGCSLSMDVALF